MTEVTIRIEEKKKPGRPTCKCPACGGAGTIGYGLMGITRHTCKKCKGKGWILC